MMGGREGAAYAVDVARKAGCRVLVVTVDTAAGAPTDRPYRPLPMKIDIGTALMFTPQAWNKPQWLWSLLRGGLVMRAPNAPRNAAGAELSLSEAGKMIIGTPPTWEDLAWVRAQWQGPLVVKGVMRAEDAKRAIDIGADAISVSNHGGKVLDGASASISMLPEIAEAVAGQIEVLLDGGVRRGADIARACALGAKAVMIGRPYLWGLAVGGQAGVSDILRVFRASLSATLAQIGCPSIAALDRSWLRPLPDEALWNEVPVESYARFSSGADD